MHILYIDDEPIQRTIIGNWLGQCGHTYTAFDNQADFLAALPQSTYDLLLVDWVLPKGSGEEIITWVRKNLGWSVPLIVLTAMEDEDNVVKALQKGADDYVVKRSSANELNARITALLRRVKPSILPTVQLSVYEADLIQLRFRMNGEIVPLTQKEFDLVSYLMQHPDKLLSREHLLQKIWGMDADADTRTVDTHISRLRKKLLLDGTYGWGLAPIYGFGYRLEKKEGATAKED